MENIEANYKRSFRIDGYQLKVESKIQTARLPKGYEILSVQLMPNKGIIVWIKTKTDPDLPFVKQLFKVCFTDTLYDNIEKAKYLGTVHSMDDTLSVHIFDMGTEKI